MSSILIKNGEIIDFENFVFKKSDILVEENGDNFEINSEFDNQLSYALNLLAA